MSVLDVVCSSWAIEHGNRRIDAAVQLFSRDAVDKARAITTGVINWPSISSFIVVIRGIAVVLVECQHTFRVDSVFFKSKLPLVAMTVEGALNDADVRKRRRDRSRLVVTETIDDDDLAGPTQAFECACDIWRFVVRQYQRSDLVEHLGRGFASVADHVLPEPRRAAIECETEISERMRGHKPRQCFYAEELDVPAVVKHREV